MVFGSSELIILKRYVFYGTLLTGKSGKYIATSSLPFAWFQIVLLLNSLYFGTSSIKRTLAKASNFFCPFRTYLANYVDMSLTDGQYFLHSLTKKSLNTWTLGTFFVNNEAPISKLWTLFYCWLSIMLFLQKRLHAGAT